VKKIDISSAAYPNTFVMVDDSDFEWLSQWKWSIRKGHGTLYARRRIGERETIYMHRLIVGAAAKEEVDHINGNGLDNQRSNLRKGSTRQNQWNTGKRRNGVTSRFKGVSFDRRRNKYYAEICVSRKRIKLGAFSCELDAARAYDSAAKKHHGDFAKTNLE
jgi:hypothetical protein